MKVYNDVYLKKFRHQLVNLKRVSHRKVKASGRKVCANFVLEVLLTTEFVYFLSHT